MRIAVMGTGGVGGYFGARLAQAGCDVAFIARGAHLAAIRDSGLLVERPLGDIRLASVRATADPATLGKVDLVLFAVKLWDTEAAAERIRPLIGAETAVVSLQNGVQKDEVLRRVLGPEPVMGGVCYVAAVIDRPGVVKQTGTMERLVFGEYDGTVSRRGEALLDACKKAGLAAELSRDIRRAIWEKFVFLVGISAATASTRRTIGEIRAHPLTRAFLRDLMDETVAVGRAHGVTIADEFVDERMRFLDAMEPGVKASMAHDLDRGNRLELMWLSGAVAELGPAVKVPTPLNRAVRDVLVLHAEGKPQ
jgi:2-dehydropantoate 2-reductase